MISAAPLPTKIESGPSSSTRPSFAAITRFCDGYSSSRARSFLGRITSRWKCIKNSLVA